MERLSKSTARVPEQPEPDKQPPGRWRGMLQHLGLGRPAVTTDSEAIDPLGGFLHPNWENRKAAEDAEARRFVASRLARRAFRGFVAWVKADEPNMTTGDTMLIVDKEEEEDPIPLSRQQKTDIEETAAMFENVGPGQTDFYKPFRAPNPLSDGQPASSDK
jgi:hypothetical protein